MVCERIRLRWSGRRCPERGAVPRIWIGGRKRRRSPMPECLVRITQPKNRSQAPGRLHRPEPFRSRAGTVFELGLRQRVVAAGARAWRDLVTPEANSSSYRFELIDEPRSACRVSWSALDVLGGGFARSAKGQDLRLNEVTIHPTT